MFTHFIGNNMITVESPYIGLQFAPFSLVNKEISKQECINESYIEHVITLMLLHRLRSIARLM
jgi:hypothetical protein